VPKSFKNLIGQLRQLDESIKKKLFFGLTAVSTLIVIFLWTAYLNMTVASIDDGSRRSSLSNVDVFRAGLAVIADKVELGLANSYVFFHNKLSQGKTFTISK
jgi:hypothetical protein